MPGAALARDAADLPGRLLSARVDGVGGAAREGSFELLGDSVDGHDRLGPGEPQGGDHLEPHAAAPDDAGALARLHVRRVAHRAEAGHDGAAHEGGVAERDAFGDRNRGGRRDDAALGEARDREEVLQRRPVLKAQACRSVEHRARERGLVRRVRRGCRARRGSSRTLRRTGRTRTPRALRAARARLPHRPPRRRRLPRGRARTARGRRPCGRRRDADPSGTRPPRRP